MREAAEHDAIETLLMSDSIFRVRDFVARRKYVDLVEQVGGEKRVMRQFAVEHNTYILLGTGQGERRAFLLLIKPSCDWREIASTWWCSSCLALPT